MASVKQLLDATLESFATHKKEWVAHQTMPSEQIIDLTGSVVAWTEGHSVNSKKVVVAYDGWLDFAAYADGGMWEMHTWNTIGAGDSGDISRFYGQFFIPVRAGQAVGFNSSGVKNLRVRLFRMVSAE